MRISLILGTLMGSGCTSTSSDTADATLGNPMGCRVPFERLHPASFLRKVHCGYRMIPCCSVTSQPIGFTCWDGTETQIFRAPSGVSNGLILDASDRLLAAEHKIDGSRERRMAPSPRLWMPTRAFHLNSPNDLVLRQSGHLYFSDPRMTSMKPSGSCHQRCLCIGTRWGAVFNLGGAVDTRPNGVGLSPMNARCMSVLPERVWCVPLSSARMDCLCPMRCSPPPGRVPMG